MKICVIFLNIALRGYLREMADVLIQIEVNRFFPGVTALLSKELKLLFKDSVFFVLTFKHYKTRCMAQSVG